MQGQRLIGTSLCFGDDHRTDRGRSMSGGEEAGDVEVERSRWRGVGNRDCNKESVSLPTAMSLPNANPGGFLCKQQ